MNSESALFTILVILATVLLSWRGFGDSAFLARFLFDSRRVVPGGEVVRLLSAGFLHAGWVHLGFNMWALYLFGSDIERGMGAGFLLAVYFAGIVGGNLLSLLLNLRRDYRALGASGGTSGVLFAHTFLFPGGSLLVFPIPFPIPSWLFVLGFVGVSILGIQRRADGIGHDAHLGGALIGLFTATLLEPAILSVNQPVYLAVVGMSAAFLAWTALGRRGVGRAPRRGVPFRVVPPEGPPGGGGSDREDRDAVIDLLLEKVSRGGMQSLTPEERALLEQLAREKRGR